ncbi:ribonuclease H-like domain-containing protein [Tanacetum coccineum]
MPPPIFDPPNPQTNTNPVNEPPRTHPIITRSQSGIVKPIERLSLHISSLSPIPKSLFIALKDLNWCNAMYDEYNALVKNGTWILVPRPSDVNLVRSMWLFKHKFHADGTLSCYKARFVANGSNQQYGVDFDETFSPVVKPAAIRTVLSLAVLLYGLNIHATSCLVPAVAYLLIYVDDIILTASSLVLLQQIVDSLHKEFDMTDLGALNYFLGILCCSSSYRVIFVSEEICLMRLIRARSSVICFRTTSLVGYTDADLAGWPYPPSSDEATPHGNNGGETELLYPNEYLNSLKFAGLPPHRLEAKVRAPITLLRNLNLTGGLCNGTRMIVTQILNKVIEAGDGAMYGDHGGNLQNNSKGDRQREDDIVRARNHQSKGHQANTYEQDN